MQEHRAAHGSSGGIVAADLDSTASMVAYELLTRIAFHKLLRCNAVYLNEGIEALVARVPFSRSSPHGNGSMKVRLIT